MKHYKRAWLPLQERLWITRLDRKREPMAYRKLYFKRSPWWWRARARAATRAVR